MKLNMEMQVPEIDIYHLKLKLNTCLRSEIRMSVTEDVWGSGGVASPYVFVSALY